MTIQLSFIAHDKKENDDIDSRNSKHLLNIDHIQPLKHGKNDFLAIINRAKRIFFSIHKKIYKSLYADFVSRNCMILNVLYITCLDIDVKIG